MNLAGQSRRILYALIISIQEDLQELLTAHVIPHLDNEPLFPTDTYDKICDRIKRENLTIDENPSKDLQIVYADFGHILDALQSHKLFLPPSVQTYFSRIKTDLSKIIQPRNRVMHGRPLEFDDFTYITELSKKLVRERTDFWSGLRATLGELKTL